MFKRPGEKLSKLAKVVFWIIAVVLFIIMFLAIGVMLAADAEFVTLTALGLFGICLIAVLSLYITVLVILAFTSMSVNMEKMESEISQQNEMIKKLIATPSPELSAPGAEAPVQE